MSRVVEFIEDKTKYWDLIKILVRRELTVKYRGSILGYLWSMLNPLLFMLIISVVFSFVVRGIEDYNLFVLSGILFWNFISLSLNLGVSSIVRNGSLATKVKVPLWIFPVVPVFFAVSNLLLSLIPYVLLYIVKGRSLPSELWLAPFVMGCTLVFLSGITLALSMMNVFFRDVQHILEPLLTLLFYASPVIYMRTSKDMPQVVSDLLLFNPFTHFVEAFRATVYGGAHISLKEAGILVTLALSSSVIGWLCFRAGRKQVAFNL